MLILLAPELPAVPERQYLLDVCHWNLPLTQELNLPAVHGGLRTVLSSGDLPEMSSRLHELYV